MLEDDIVHWPWNAVDKESFETVSSLIEHCPKPDHLTKDAPCNILYSPPYTPCATDDEKVS